MWKGKKHIYDILKVFNNAKVKVGWQLTIAPLGCQTKFNTILPLKKKKYIYIYICFLCVLVT